MKGFVNTINTFRLFHVVNFEEECNRHEYILSYFDVILPNFTLSDVRLLSMIHENGKTFG